MNIKKSIISILSGITVIGLLFSSCQKEESDTNKLKTYADTVNNINNQVHEVMRLNYLWYDSMPSVNHDNYNDPMKFIHAIENWRDHWSFILTNDEYQSQFVTGDYYGFGFASGFDNEMKLRVAYVFKSSALYKAGVTRGWTIKSINGVTPDTINFNSIFGENEKISKVFSFTRTDGKDTTISFTKKTITQNTVLAYDTLHVNSKVVGYISFLAFDLDADTELQQAFTYFQSNNVSELVLDLRYNGGGDLAITQNLANMLGGSSAAGKTFVNLTFNNKNTKQNQSFAFQSSPNALNINRLFVISTNETASASEVIINSLRGVDMPVILIGSHTNGKPVGMMQYKLNFNYYLYAINFKMTNAKGFGDYYGGLPVDKSETDDITHNFGDSREACLAQALYYIQNGNFKPTAKSAKITNYQSKIYVEKRLINFITIGKKYQ